MERIIPIFGLFVFLGIAFLLSENRSEVNIKTVIGGILLQLVFGFLILIVPQGRFLFEILTEFVATILDFAADGAVFVFGEELVHGVGGALDGYFEEAPFAFYVLPTIIYFSALMSLFYYLGIIQKVVKVMASVMKKAMDLSGAESLAAAANVFIGQTEAPLVIKKYLPQMTRSEVMALMTGGMATVAGGVFAAFVGMGIDPGYLLAASIMSAPASLVMAKIMIPEIEESTTAGTVKVNIELEHDNVLGVVADGASEGLKLALNVAAMLIAFMAIIALINHGLGFFGTSLEGILGLLFSPFAYLMGVPMEEAREIGSLLGQKMAINEFVAYASLTELIAEEAISQRSQAIATFALCGFANFGSIAIQIGGIGPLDPDRKGMIASLGVRALIAGTLATYTTATIAGLFIG
ncbi:NupC/NupG family nucleoside CNT transporter [Halanaerobiaceae bacterium Z-7014]|uniref:NupC/NupG family nucleoside CNT transporter n=1 Tax=Halonatronomonas betaini TaxID=2778430 RepID=A0A931ASR8_9FIRM|nr:nucleoside transporter C-terminal domain-containing protein [Halonatronomonas betaini]MBF8436125.1 NupC/NupG family nucleoside CNT transporter [Halonatronomonas betaini]